MLFFVEVILKKEKKLFCFIILTIILNVAHQTAFLIVFHDDRPTDGQCIQYTRFHNKKMNGGGGIEYNTV